MIEPQTGQRRKPSREQQRSRPSPGDETYGCVDWFIYEADESEPSRTAAAPAPLQGRVVDVRRSEPGP